jgi:hypothetical protein
MNRVCSYWRHFFVTGYTFPCGHESSTTSLSGPGILSPVDIPWSGHITKREETSIDDSFAAILVTPSLVLASAHYLLSDQTTRFHIYPVSSYFATFGTRYFGDPVHFDGSPIKIRISQIRVNPGYKAGSWLNDQRKDYALFHLAEPIPSNSSNVEPICLLNFTPNNDENSEIILTGWNRGISENMMLKLNPQSETECKKFWTENEETNPFPYEGKWCATVGRDCG